MFCAIWACHPPKEHKGVHVQQPLIIGLCRAKLQLSTVGAPLTDTASHRCHPSHCTKVSSAVSYGKTNTLEESPQKCEVLVMSFGI